MNLLNTQQDVDQGFFAVKYVDKNFKAQRALVWAHNSIGAANAVQALAECAWVDGWEWATDAEHRAYAKNHDYI